MPLADFQAFIKGKKVTLMGLGLLGRGVGDARFLATCGADLIVTDLKAATELSESLEQLKGLDISFHLGGHDLKDFQNRDLILKAAGVPLDSPYVAEARRQGTPVRMSADLLVEYAGAKTIGVTGTRGKSTVAHLIAHTLRCAGKHVLLGGNIRGISSIALLPEVRPDSFIVLELDSWQLQGFGEARLSPHIAVFTNLKQDHLNYYPDEATYFADKANIFRFQREGDVLIAGREVADAWIRPSNLPVAPLIPTPLARIELKLRGEHNRENAALAAEALRAAGLTEEEIREGLESFEPVEGRLQLLGEVQGVQVFNDNNATTPDATLSALQTLSAEFPGKLVLIVGGADKGLDDRLLAETIPDLVHAALFLPGTGTDRLKPSLLPLLEAKGIVFQNVSHLKEALALALSYAKPQGAVLFSPGFASFGLFKNEYDRNDQFLNAFAAL